MPKCSGREGTVTAGMSPSSPCYHCMTLLIVYQLLTVCCDTLTLIETSHSKKYKKANRNLYNIDKAICSEIYTQKCETHKATYHELLQCH